MKSVDLLLIISTEDLPQDSPVKNKLNNINQSVFINTRYTNKNSCAMKKSITLKKIKFEQKFFFQCLETMRKFSGQSRKCANQISHSSNLFQEVSLFTKVPYSCFSDSLYCKVPKRMENILPCKVTSPRHPFLRSEKEKSNCNAMQRQTVCYKSNRNLILFTTQAFGIFITSVLNQVSFDGHSLRKTFPFPQVSRFLSPTALCSTLSLPHESVECSGQNHRAGKHSCRTGNPLLALI